MKPNRKSHRSFWTSLLAVAAACASLSGSARSAADTTPAVLTAMQEELDRGLAAESKADPAAYFLNYTVSDREYAEVSGSNGALMSSSETRARWLEVQTRVGSYQLDNTHKIADHPPSWTSPGTNVALDDDIRGAAAGDVARDGPAISRRGRSVDQSDRPASRCRCRPRKATRRISRTKSRTPSSGRAWKLKWTGKPWEERVRKYTAAFSASPAVLNSIATFTAQADNQYK